MRIPQKEKDLIQFAKEVIEICSVSMGARGSAYKQYSQYIETGRADGSLSLANRLYAHCDRLQSHLFCPTEARFGLDFEFKHSKTVLQQAEAVARNLTRNFTRNNLDLRFSDALSHGIAFGAGILKTSGSITSTQIDGKRFTHLKELGTRVVPPWQFGVYNEGVNGLENQEAVVEFVPLSDHDVWRRVKNLPDAEKLYRRITGAGYTNTRSVMPSSFVQVLSTSQININQSGSNPVTPGGLLQISGDPSIATTGPQVLAKFYNMFEVWVWDDDAEDYLMIQMIEPDVLISPRYKLTNEFCPDTLCYNLVQPNIVPGYFWGRSEIVDLLSLQSALSETMDDFRRIVGVQYDKRIAMEGFDGDPQELYDDFRSAGWISGRAGAKVTDMTPKVPTEALQYISTLTNMMDEVAGFGNILSGSGEAGVRAGNHAQTLLKTASPRLRDRSLIVERQYAAHGDTILHYMEAKDGQEYYFDPDKPEESSFLLSQIPEDRRVVVDSHSTSPVYENDNIQLTTFLFKAGLYDAARTIKLLNPPDADEAIREVQEREKQKAAQMEKLKAENPDLWAKLQSGGARRR